MQHRVGSHEIVCEKGRMTQKEKLGQKEILPSLVAEQSWIAALLLMRSYRSKLSTLRSQDLPRRPAGHSGGLIKLVKWGYMHSGTTSMR